MSDRVRLRVFLVAGAGLAALLVWGLAGLPDFGHYRGPLGDIYNALSVPKRSTTDVVTAVNFDFRGFDTLGEEFILFTAVVGVASLLRRLRGERERRPRVHVLRVERAGLVVRPHVDADPDGRDPKDDDADDPRGSNGARRPCDVARVS